MFGVIILIFVLSAFLSYFYFTQTINSSSGLLSALAQENNIDLTGIWESDNGTQLNITQIDSQVAASFVSVMDCDGGRHDMNNYENNFAFKGKLEGNQVIGKESAAQCYFGSSNPDENGLFIDPFEATISENGNKLTLSIHNRYAQDEVLSQSFSKISGLDTVQGSPSSNQVFPNIGQLGNTFNSTLSQAQSTVDQFGNTFNSTLSQAEQPITALQQNNLPFLILFAGLAVAAIGGTAAYVKSRSSKRSQHKGSNVAVITRGGIE